MIDLSNAGALYRDKIDVIRFKEYLTQKDIEKMIGLSYQSIFRNRPTKRFQFKTLRAMRTFVNLYEKDYETWNKLREEALK